MCGRYTVIRHDQIIRLVFNITVPANLRQIARFNIAPSQLIPVITNASNELQLFRWGLIPSWAKDERIGNSLINARAETLAKKPAFRTALRRRRCLIPADGFYEWQKQSDGSKTPIYVTLQNNAPFAFAGLWETWQPPGGEVVHSCTIITTTPNDVMKPIHDRMPVILFPDAYATWLSPEEKPADELLNLLQPYSANEMSVRPVSRLVNNPKNEGPELLLADSSPSSLF